MALPASAIDGVVVTALQAHEDDRGAFLEAFRAAWSTQIAPVQWNVVKSEPNVLRGLHVHVRHSDYLLCVSGELLLGLRDIRPWSPTHNRTELLTLRGDDPAAVTMPPGVAHGFYFATHSIHMYAVSHYWDTADELGCHWADPAIGLTWPTQSPRLSDRDKNAASFAEMTKTFLNQHQSKNS